MKLVLLDDDVTLTRTLSRRLEGLGHQVQSYNHAVSPDELIAEQADCYLLDLRFGTASGLDYVAPLRQQLPLCRIVLLTGYASIATAVQAVKAGADDYLTKPVDFVTLTQALSGQVSQTAPNEADVLSTDQLEWEHIQRVLEQHQGNISQTAKALAMHRRTLQRKLQKHRP
ncbi:response regulator [Rheinheimera soli]|uniref:Two-component system response regulator RegA n=1 Tax=Rheinheimera soli TaxID=443616 RepID=A0ABU1VYB5_9GAMM|nr:response regulator [Rheinheimera soli]MDR7120453.1 two-component system response regulator RegA [Rheinheimera soli]